MGLFKNAFESHQHSIKTLETLFEYDSFLDSLEFVADFGCGHGLDSQWWANLETRDDPPEPRNYKVYSVDKNFQYFDKEVEALPNVFKLERNLESPDFSLPRKVDFIWCHDTFQYMVNPVGTLRNWSNYMNENGMLLLIFPQAQHYAYNRLQSHSYNFNYFNHNIVNLMYMLAVNGFDCRDAYFLKEENNAWLHAAVYKTNLQPMDPANTNWYQLAELNLLNDSVVKCLNTYGYVKQEAIITSWLDKDFYFPKE